jgi:peroxiredoxin
VELGELRDRFEDFERRGVAIVAASADPPEKLRATRSSWRIPFPILSAGGGAALDVLGIRHPNAHAGRDSAVPTLLLVDGAGRVRNTYQSRQSHLRLTPDAVLAWIDAP